MRKLMAALVLATSLCGTNLGAWRAIAAPPSDYASTDGVPVATSFIYPVGVGTNEPTWTPGNSNGYFITQGFNNSCDPSLGQGYYLYGLYYCGHTGVDLASADASDGVHATAAGIVVEAGYNGGYGVMVRIKHYLPDGSVVYSQYEHMAYGSLAVYTGEIVSQGQELGLVGATGFATGAHLHFEIKSVNEDGWGYTFGNGALIVGYFDPLPFVASHQAQPVLFNPGTGQGHLVWPAESEYVLQHYLSSYKHFVVVSVDKGDGLRVRRGPGLHYAVLGVALRGAKLGYLRTQGQWINVALPQNVRGWVNRGYVAGYQDWDRPSRARLIWPPAGPVATVAAIGLNVRAAPGQSHPVISSVYQGDKVALLFRTTNWAQVRTRDGTRGWVLRRYLREPGVPPPPVTVRYIVPIVPLLHVRSGPGLQYMITGSVYSSTRMQIVSQTPTWVAVILPGSTTGWVARPLTGAAGRGTNTTPAAAPGTRAQFVRVSTGVLNIRSGPGRGHPVIATVLRNTTLQVLSVTAHWAHVALPASRIDGWVLRSLTVA